MNVKIIGENKLFENYENDILFFEFFGIGIFKCYKML